MNNKIGRFLPTLALLLCAQMSVAETKLSADAANIDGQHGQTGWTGNASLLNDNMRINADEMVTEQLDNGDLKLARLQGHPARLIHTDPVTGASAQAEANIILYHPLDGLIELNGNAHLRQDDVHANAHTRIDAAHIHVQQKNNQLAALDADGAPAQFERSVGEQAAYIGQAQSIRYRADGELLTLEGEAKLTQGKNTIEHDVILHDGIRKTTTAPKREGSQVRITRQSGPDVVPSNSDAPKKDVPKPDGSKQDASNLNKEAPTP